MGLIAGLFDRYSTQANCPQDFVSQCRDDATMDSYGEH